MTFTACLATFRVRCCSTASRYALSCKTLKETDLQAPMIMTAPKSLNAFQSSHMTSSGLEPSGKPHRRRIIRGQCLHCVELLALLPRPHFFEPLDGDTSLGGGESHFSKCALMFRCASSITPSSLTACFDPTLTPRNLRLISAFTLLRGRTKWTNPVFSRSKVALLCSAHCSIFGITSR